jgi:protein-tyrosine kinase
VSAPNSNESPSGNLSDADAGVDLKAGLLARCKLSPEKIRAVYELMPRESLSFVDAALRLGFVTHAEVADALVWAKKSQSQEFGGLIETAIRKVSNNRQLVLAQGEAVTPGRQLILAYDADNPRSEKIRSLRTELLLLNDARSGAHTIALLSPCSGEGRSQLAAELAVSFSQLGRRTLLVDADMRRPKQHVLFGSANQIGLCDAISGDRKPWFHPVNGLPHLSLLTSGLTPPNPLELLSGGRFTRLLQDWRKSFEFVILDTPPVKDYADALAVASLAGRVLVLSRGKHTSFSDTRNMLRRLESTQSKILGAIINHFETNT